MSDSKDVKRAILELHIGKDVTVILGRGGESSVFAGKLQQEKIPGGDCYWSLQTDRGIARQGANAVAVPRSAVYFTTEQFGHLIYKLETQEQALEEIRKEEAKKQRASKLVDPSGQVLQ